MQRWAFCLAGLATFVALGCGQRPRERTADPTPAPRPTFTLFGLAEVRGQIEPCGCTTDPLGDLARTASLVESARAQGPVLVLDAGSLLYAMTPVPPHLQGQEKLKSDLIVKAYAERLKAAAIGLGPADLGMGAAAVRPPRQAVNVPAAAGVAIEPPRIVEVDGAKVGVFGVVAPGMLPGVTVDDPGPVAAAAVADLKKRGAQLIVALVQAQDVRTAEGLVRAAKGVDLAIAGLGSVAPEPDKVSPVARDVDGAWMVIPANRGQVVSRLDITLRPGGGPLVDAVGEGAAEVLRQELAARIQAQSEELATFEKQADADPAFLAVKRRELAELHAEDEALTKNPLRVPAKGSYFALTQVRIRKKLACDTEIQAAKTAYSRAAGEANLAAAKDAHPAKPAPGQPGYVGSEACSDCHAEADEFWQKTRHAGAWETLETYGKQYDYECIGCHVTGWDQPGGSTLADNQSLRDVQCEVCHGPGSIHVAKMGEDRPRTIRRAPAEALCATQCHTTQHSDTFQYEAYLRDVTGVGHGEDVRKKLGDGPTGHELRAAGLARAGKEIGAGCAK